MNEKMFLETLKLLYLLLAGVIGHEAVHIILKSYGLLGEPARAYQEWIAYSVEYRILESLLGPKFPPEMQRAIRAEIEKWRRKIKP